MKKYGSLNQTKHKVFAVGVLLMLVAAAAGSLDTSYPVIGQNSYPIISRSVPEQTRELTGADQVDTKAALPSGDWSFSAHPYFGPGYESRAVIVTSVSADASKGLSVTKVGLRNNTSKTVSAVKLGWYLYNEEEPNAILLEGRTPLIGLKDGLASGERTFLALPVVTFAKSLNA